MLCGGSNGQLVPWDFSVETLRKETRPKQGYTLNSRAVQFLFTILSEMSPLQQRQFVRFVTGAASCLLDSGLITILNRLSSFTCGSTQELESAAVDHACELQVSDRKSAFCSWLCSVSSIRPISGGRSCERIASFCHDVHQLFEAARLSELGDHARKAAAQHPRMQQRLPAFVSSACVCLPRTSCVRC